MSEPVIVGDAPVCEAKDMLEAYEYFTTPVYKISKPQYLNEVKKVMFDAIDEIKKTNTLDPIYPLYQTGNLTEEPSIKDFVDFVGATGWNILESQGYNMQDLTVFFQEFWGQQHYKHSAHEEHVHGYGCQLVGFYFLDVPEDSGRMVIHDPRPAKKLVNLPEVDMSKITMGSTAINFIPEPGDLFFVPSWVPHSFTRHSVETPLNFIHFTLGVSYIKPTVEVDSLNKCIPEIV